MTEVSQYVEKAVFYAEDVLSGQIPSCIYVKQACQRFIDDLDRSDIYLDINDAHRWCANIEKFKHVKGKWAAGGQRFVLAPFQVFCTVNMYGWKVKETNRRRFTEAYIEVPRKNGKTFWVACLGIGHLTWDNEPGAEVYCGATSEKQAFEVFTPAKAIIEGNQILREKYDLVVNAKSIYSKSSFSKFQPLVRNPGDGSSPSCSIADELHQHQNSKLIDSQKTGMGARENPMMIYTTTAGADIGGPCYEKRSDLISILSGAAKESGDSFFGIIYTIDDGDDWETVESQKKANPNFGVSVDEKYLAAQLDEAKRSAVAQVSYKTKHLNLWVGAKAAWMNMLAFQKCRNPNIKIEDFKGQQCFLGGDFASKIDMSCLAILFPPCIVEPERYTVFLRHYLPEVRINTGASVNSPRYKQWHSQGILKAFPGERIEFADIEHDVKQLAQSYEIVEFAFDPYQSTQFATEMARDGFNMVEYGQTVQNISEPMKELEAKILAKQIQFTMDPIINWMFNNVTAKIDKKDNIFPNKEFPENKIDGVIATIMALARAMFHEKKFFIGKDYKLTVV